MIGGRKRVVEINLLRQLERASIREIEDREDCVRANIREVIAEENELKLWLASLNPRKPRRDTR